MDRQRRRPVVHGHRLAVHPDRRHRLIGPWSHGRRHPARPDRDDRGRADLSEQRRRPSSRHFCQRAFALLRRPGGAGGKYDNPDNRAARTNHATGPNLFFISALI